MRTTLQKVKDILDDTSLSDAILTSVIDSANIFVTESLTGKGLSDNALAEIERWLAGHMVAVTRERTAAKEGAGTAFIHYTGTWGEGLLSTSYGQTAVMLDTSGTLANIAKVKSSAWVKAVPNFDD